MELLLLHGGLLLDPERPAPEAGSLLLDGGRIAARLEPGAKEPSDAQRIDLGGRSVAPGWIDLHHHGRVIFSDADHLRDDLRHDAAEMVRHGTTAFLATTVSTPRAELGASVERLARSIDDLGAEPAATPLGIHLEGPWINPGAAGAHSPSGIRECARDELRELWTRSAGRLRMVTFAPEIPGARELLDQLVRHGIVAALGHSLASAEQVEEAVTRGARHVTHLWNAMGPTHQRAPGLTGTALSDDRLSCDLICDGVHVDPRWIALTVRAKRDRLVLITDRVDPPSGADEPLAGASRTHGPALRLADGRLAGSNLHLDRALANARALGGMTRLEAVAACTLRPARVLGVESERGTFRAGARADLAILAGDDRVSETWIGGRCVYRSG